MPVDELASDQPRRYTVETAEAGVNYALIITNCAGCWSYIVGDIVRFVSLDPPRIMIAGRTKQSLSAFGEHIIGEELERAVTNAAISIGATVADFSVGAVVADGAGELGHHLYIIEFDGPGLNEPQAAEIIGKIDADLIAGNNDYRVHRADGFGIKAPEIIAAPKGTFADWMKARGRLGGQNKVPRIINDADTLASLVAMARKDR